MHPFSADQPAKEDQKKFRLKTNNSATTQRDSGRTSGAKEINFKRRNSSYSPNEMNLLSSLSLWCLPPQIHLILMSEGVFKDYVFLKKLVVLFIYTTDYPH